MIQQFKTQEDYNNFFDKMRLYANQKASKIFYDVSLRQEAIDKAMDKVEDLIIQGRKMNESYLRKAIDFSLRDSQKLRQIEPVNLKGSGYESWGFRGRKVRNK